MSEYDEQLAALRANIDQAVAASAEVARSVAAYFNALTAAGFSRPEALALTCRWQQFLVSGAPRDESTS